MKIYQCITIGISGYHFFSPLEQAEADSRRQICRSPRLRGQNTADGDLTGAIAPARLIPQIAQEEIARWREK